MIKWINSKFEEKNTTAKWHWIPCVTDDICDRWRCRMKCRFFDMCCHCCALENIHEPGPGVKDRYILCVLKFSIPMLTKYTIWPDSFCNGLNSLLFLWVSWTSALPQMVSIRAHSDVLWVLCVSMLHNVWCGLGKWFVAVVICHFSP